MNFSQLYTDGAWVAPLSTDRIAVENPATREIIAHVPACGQADTDRAVAAANAAAPRWQGTSPAARIEIAQRALEHLLAARDDIIELEIAELGSSRKQTVAAHFEFQVQRIRTFIRLAERIPWETKLEHSTMLREPFGVVAAITPWNYPLGQVVQKLLPALLTGNTVVLKPSQHTPLTVYYLVDAFHRAGLPAGVLNLVTGRGGEVGDRLSAHPDVDMVSFTGSTSGGITVAQKALQTVKQIHLELGGKSPLLLLPGGDAAVAARVTLGSLLPNCGQTCSALSRLLVPIDRKEEAEAAVRQELARYTVGDPTDPATDIGCLSGRRQYDKVRHYIEQGLAEGATMLTGSVPPADPQGGYFVEPVVFTDVTPQMTIAREEIFGPVLSVLTYTDIDEGVRLANDTVYGLNAAVCGPHAEAVRVAKRIRSGNVYINDAPRDITAPFGGYKQSGIGREGGLVGLLDFTQTKVIFDETRE